MRYFTVTVLNICRWRAGPRVWGGGQVEGWAQGMWILVGLEGTDSSVV